MFFPRLRRQAKWMFVFLALVFGLGFVVFGVGSDVPGGIADVLQGRAPQAGPSVEEAREKLERNPNDPAALRELATALQADGQRDEAIAALERYTAVRPRDEAALTELAGLYLGKAARLRGRVQNAQIEGLLVAPAGEFLPPPTSPLGQALANQALTQAVQARAQERITRLYGEMQAAYEEAKQTYVRLARLMPDDAAVQLQLAEAALNAGDTSVALSAYSRFLELAPDDPNAPLVREQIKRLQEGPGAAGG